MNYDHLRIHFIGGLHIDEYPSENKIEIDCPNDANGIGNITFHGKSRFYSGQWFSCDNFATQFSNLVRIELISLCEEDAPILLWKVSNKIPSKKYHAKKYYEWWYKAAVDIKIALNTTRIKIRLNELECERDDDE